MQVFFYAVLADMTAVLNSGVYMTLKHYSDHLNNGINWNRWEAESFFSKKESMELLISLEKLEFETACGNCGVLKYTEDSFIIVSVWHLVYCFVDRLHMKGSKKRPGSSF